ncbi:IclR family transcriptional regulator [Brenneria izadpanahii]|uniref:IclR family transcriptional regulator n=1 Tax=Brenneria izadpanahii TaxID=2722756 RepID=A0ABX7UWL5_9GAMM|nr:IclR family transcriptional regulator [Brenneria izadpanahii]QTF10106.1 IclR family transcriptional regulator [Brenneria izadpanahii]
MLETTSVPALTRAIAILHFISQRGPCTAAEIIEGLALPKSSTYLLLAELKRQRFITMDIYDNYCLWTRLVELAGHALERMDIRDIARKRLTLLMQETDLLCHLGIIDNGNAYYILKIESTSTISVRSHEGKSLSLYRSGIGKCLLAWQSEEEQERIIAGLRFAAVTPHTLKNADALKAELTRIRRQGWSFDNGEDYPDVRCVAAPIFNARNELTAAISLVGTSLQISEDNREYLASRAIACARDISRLLGWRSPLDQHAS